MGHPAPFDAIACPSQAAHDGSWTRVGRRPGRSHLCGPPKKEATRRWCRRVLHLRVRPVFVIHCSPIAKQRIVLLEHIPYEFEPEVWRRRPDLNGDGGFGDLAGSCIVLSRRGLWSVQPPCCLVFATYWTTCGLRPPAIAPPPSCHSARPLAKHSAKAELSASASPVARSGR